MSSFTFESAQVTFHSRRPESCFRVASSIANTTSGSHFANKLATRSKSLKGNSRFHSGVRSPGYHSKISLGGKSCWEFCTFYPEIRVSMLYRRIRGREFLAVIARDALRHVKNLSAVCSKLDRRKIWKFEDRRDEVEGWKVEKRKNGDILNDTHRIFCRMQMLFLFDANARVTRFLVGKVGGSAGTSVSLRDAK